MYFDSSTLEFKQILTKQSKVLILIFVFSFDSWAPTSLRTKFKSTGITAE